MGTISYQSKLLMYLLGEKIDGETSLGEQDPVKRALRISYAHTPTHTLTHTLPSISDKGKMTRKTRVGYPTLVLRSSVHQLQNQGVRRIQRLIMTLVRKNLSVVHALTKWTMSLGHIAYLS